MQLALVTGALGWLGQSLTRALVKSEWRIRALILPGQREALGDQIEVVTGDLRNPADAQRLCAGAERAVLFHTAGIIHPQRVCEFYEVNVAGTRNLLDAASQAGLRRVVVVSSNSPCGCNPHPDHLFDEDSPYAPYMNYGRSKMLMELAVQECQRAGKLETVIIRAPWFYGPFQPLRQTLFFTMVREGKFPIVGGGENLRSMAYVDNLSQGLILAAVTPQANGHVYWIADERPYSMNEVVDTVERLLRDEFKIPCTGKRMRMPGIASECAWLIDKTTQAMGIYLQRIHVLSEMNKTIACSTAKAQRELGYKPAIDLEEGMRRSIQWCRETGVRI